MVPLFEFRCKHCNTEFEELCRSNRDVEQAKCPECQSSDVTKLLSIFGIHSRGRNPNDSSSSSGSKCRSCQRNTCKNCA
ncbi:zinc ribbon domain-containing protein [Candidatus Poribacteria bacterium]|nr:zinc ribbon domain-containing protein [Candidatus Poribacteria bacterium]